MTFSNNLFFLALLHSVPRSQHPPRPTVSPRPPCSPLHVPPPPLCTPPRRAPFCTFSHICSSFSEWFTCFSEPPSQSGFKLTVWSKLTFNFWSSYLHHPNARITGVCRHAWLFMQCWGSDSALSMSPKHPVELCP